MTRCQVLIIEADRDLSLRIKQVLEGACEVVIAETGRAAFDLLAGRVPDVIILDLDLSVLSGIKLCRMLRRRSDIRSVPIIGMSVRSSEADRLAGFELGIDDYMIKPLSLRELAARVRVGARRSVKRREPPVPAYQGTLLHADFDAVAISVAGHAVQLTRREFDVLRYLVQHRNKVIPRARLLPQAWGYQRLVDPRSVDANIGRLRAKLREAARQIETVPGIGYRFTD